MGTERNRWERLLEEDDERAWLETLVERIDLKPGNRGANRFDPDRVSITWR